MKKQPMQLKELHAQEHRRQSTVTGVSFAALLLLPGFFLLVSSLLESRQVFAGLLLTLILPVAYVCGMQKRWGKWVRYSLLFLGILSIVVQPVSFVQGLLQFVNQLIAIWNHRFDTFIQQYQNASNSWLSTLQIGLLLTCLFYYLWSWCVAHQREKALALGEVAVVLAAVFFQLSLQPGICAVFAAGVLLVFLGNGIFEQGTSIMIGVLLTIGVGIALVFLGTASFQGSQQVFQIKAAVLDGVDYLRYGSDTLPRGVLTKADALVGNEENQTLELRGERFQEMHLKGFVGSTFDGTSWQSEDKSVYNEENAGMLDWLEANGLSTAYQFGRFAKNSGSITAETTFSIKNAGAYRKYLYLPYTALDLSEGNGKPCYDWQVISRGFFGAGSYAFTANARSASSEDVLQQIYDHGTTTDDYKKAESVYQNFVYRYDLDVSDEEKEQIQDQIFQKKDWSDADYYEITTQIRLKLQQLLTYQEKGTDVYDGSKDYIQWLLAKKRTGNAAAYATLAVLAYRTAGIPARYVEGYYVSADTAANASEQLTLSEADAHAWVEVYISGIGWSPVEVVPGNYYADYVIQDVAPSPDATVNVQEDNNESLKGSTADVLNTIAQQFEKTPAAIKKALPVFGGVLFAVMLLFLLWLLVRMRADFSAQRFERKLRKQGNRSLQCRLIYQQFWKLTGIVKWEGSQDFPYECAEEFAARIPEMTKEEYIRFLNLIQKSLFSEHALTDSEYRTVRIFLQRSTAALYEHATIWQKIRLRYL